MAIKGITQTSQYLTFKLDKEVYALGITQVREVLDYTEITKVPGMPVFMRGIINLRDTVVPVIDLKLKFELPETQNTVDTCIIILDFIMGKESLLMGILADSVQEVLTLEPDQVEPAPRMGVGINPGFIKGIGKKDKKFTIILNLDKLFSTEEIESVTGIEQEAPPAVEETQGLVAPESGTKEER
jgi:purine-binding chemotaxis protein CheW